MYTISSINAGESEWHRHRCIGVLLLILFEGQGGGKQKGGEERARGGGGGEETLGVVDDITLTCRSTEICCTGRLQLTGTWKARPLHRGSKVCVGAERGGGYKG